MTSDPTSTKTHTRVTVLKGVPFHKPAGLVTHSVSTRPETMMMDVPRRSELWHFLKELSLDYLAEDFERKGVTLDTLQSTLGAGQGITVMGVNVPWLDCRRLMQFSFRQTPSANPPNLSRQRTVQSRMIGPLPPLVSSPQKHTQVRPSPMPSRLLSSHQRRREGDMGLSAEMSQSHSQSQCMDSPSPNHSQASGGSTDRLTALMNIACIEAERHSTHTLSGPRSSHAAQVSTHDSHASSSSLSSSAMLPHHQSNPAVLRSQDLNIEQRSGAIGQSSPTMTTKSSRMKSTNLGKPKSNEHSDRVSNTKSTSVSHSSSNIENDPSSVTRPTQSMVSMMTTQAAGNRRSQRLMNKRLAAAALECTSSSVCDESSSTMMNKPLMKPSPPTPANGAHSRRSLASSSSNHNRDGSETMTPLPHPQSGMSESPSLPVSAASTAAYARLLPGIPPHSTVHRTLVNGVSVAPLSRSSTHEARSLPVSLVKDHEDHIVIRPKHQRPSAMISPLVSHDLRSSPPSMNKDLKNKQNNDLDINASMFHTPAPPDEGGRRLRRRLITSSSSSSVTPSSSSASVLLPPPPALFRFGRPPHHLIPPPPPLPGHPGIPLGVGIPARMHHRLNRNNNNSKSGNVGGLLTAPHKRTGSTRAGHVAESARKASVNCMTPRAPPKKRSAMSILEKYYASSNRGLSNKKRGLSNMRLSDSMVNGNQILRMRNDHSKLPMRKVRSAREIVGGLVTTRVTRSNNDKNDRKETEGSESRK